MPTVLAKILLPVAVFSSALACHARAADPPRATSPSLTFEVEDVGADHTRRVSRWLTGLHDGRATLLSRDSDHWYVLNAETRNGAEPMIAVKVERHQGTTRDLDVEGTIGAKPAGRIIVAKIDHADGRTTTVTAQVN